MALFVFICNLKVPAFPVSADTGTGEQITEVKKPEVIEKTTESIKLRTETNYEYAIETERESIKTWKWADEAQYDKVNGTVIFAGLHASTEYRFACRLIGEEAVLYQNQAETLAKPNESQNLPNDSTYPVRESPEPADGVPTQTAGISDSADVLQASVLDEAKDANPLEASLQPPVPGKPIASDVKDTEYQFCIRIAAGEYDGVTYAASEKSEFTEVVKTKKTAPVAPSAPELFKRSDCVIVLKTMENQQYGRVLADGSIHWQDIPEFGGLMPSTEYSFVARTKYDPAKEMESNISDVSKFQTAIAFQGAEISGIENGGSYEAETSQIATAVGVGMENTGPSAGDTRWAPKTWTWDGQTVKSWDSAPYIVKFRCTKPGIYELTVGYQLEEYTSEGWRATEYMNSLTTSFKIIEKKVTVYTITADSGINGKIDPSGSISVEKGKDYKFTFIPYKGYRVAKVVVDGKEVKVNSNDYMFWNVQGNHKISVTFEKDKRTPKTGDVNSVELFGGILLISGIFIVMLAYRKKKR